MATRTATAGKADARPTPSARPAATPEHPAGVLGPGGSGLLPWLAEPLSRLRANPRSAHAVLISGPAGVGQFELAVAAAQAALCEAPTEGVLAGALAKERAGDRSGDRSHAHSPDRSARHSAADSAAGRRADLACGQCAACRLVQAQTHPDLLVLLPEALREPLGWSFTAAEGDGEGASATGGASGKRKPSRELRVDDLRSAIAFAQTTSTRGGRKMVVIHPAERMNTVAANALLKTLEEPPPAVQLLLSTGDAGRLLPTLRSRCQSLQLALPPAEEAARWLQGAGGGASSAVLLQAAGGQPQEALALLADGMVGEAWMALPQRLLEGDAAALQGWPLPRLIEAQLCLCSDLQRLALGAAPRRFPAQAWPRGVALPPLAALNAWGRRLLEASRHADHPFHLPLAIDALVAQARSALTEAARKDGPRTAPAGPRAR